MHWNSLLQCTGGTARIYFRSDVVFLAHDRCNASPLRAEAVLLFASTQTSVRLGCIAVWRSQALTLLEEPLDDRSAILDRAIAATLVYRAG